MRNCHQDEKKRVFCGILLLSVVFFVKESFDEGMDRDMRRIAVDEELNFEGLEMDIVLEILEDERFAFNG